MIIVIHTSLRSITITGASYTQAAGDEGGQSPPPPPPFISSLVLLKYRLSKLNSLLYLTYRSFFCGENLVYIVAVASIVQKWARFDLKWA